MTERVRLLPLESLPDPIPLKIQFPFRDSRSELISRWAWLPLLALVLFLWSRLGDVRRETELFQTDAESSDRQAAARTPPLRAKAAPRPTPATATAAQPADPSVAKPGALESFSDRNALGEVEYGNAITRRHRRYALANYRPAIASLHLPPEEEEQLKNLLAAAWIAQEDTGDVLDRMGATTRELRAQAVAAARAESEQKIKDFLGEKNYTDLETAYALASTAKMNWQLATEFWDAGLPLTPEQQTAYARTEHQLRAQFLANPNLGARDPQTGLTARDQAFHQEAAAFLSPQQLALLRDERLAEARFAQAARELRQLKAAPKPGR